MMTILFKSTTFFPYSKQVCLTVLDISNISLLTMKTLKETFNCTSWY